MNSTSTPSLKVIKASAGSGKTYQLTYEYIKILLGKKNKDSGCYNLASREEYHQHILAITFTNKATDEMKHRIVKELHLLSQGKGDYVKQLVDDLHTDKEKLREAADVALQEILYNYTTFNVSTIDSFFQTVLRAFAFELDFDYDYQVELDSKYSTRMGVNIFLMEMGSGMMRSGLIHKWLVDFMKEQLAIGKGRWNVFQSDELREFAENITNEFYQSRKDEIDAYISDLAEDDGRNSRIERFRKAVAAKYAAAKKRKDDCITTYNEILQEAGIGETGYHLSSRSGFTILTNWCFKGKDLKAELLEKAREWTVKSLELWSTDKAWKKEVKENKHDGLIEKMRQLVEDAFEIDPQIQMLQDVQKNLFNFGLLGIIGLKMEEFLRGNKTMLLSDTNQLLKDVVRKGNVLFMYERMGTWIDHYLIDEFQDTSMMQYQNIAPLLEESASYGDDNLIIGDEKQCIYRFRNSNPDLFQNRVEQEFEQWVNVDREKVVNWRSAPNVIRFNNTLFDKIVTALSAQATYSNLIQTPNPKKTEGTGYVRVNFVAPNDNIISDPDDSDAGSKSDGAKTQNSNKYRSTVLATFPDYIESILERGYNQGDIAILVSTNNEGAEVVNCLMEYNETAERKINVVSGESVFLTASPAVRLVINNLRYFDSVNLTVCKDEQIRRAQDREAKVWRVLRDYDLRESMLDSDDPEERGRLLSQTFADDLKRKPEIAPNDREVQFADEYLEIRDELIDTVADSFNLVAIIENIVNKIVPEPERRSQKAFLTAFFDSVYDYMSRYPATVHSFLKWWDQNKDHLTVPVPEGSEAVRVITIHKSKGLEFPVVIVPFACWEMCRVKDLMWIGGENFARIPEFSDIPKEIIPPVVPMSADQVANVEELGEIYMAAVDESHIDTLNKTYVAFTRAVDELHIMAPQGDAQTDTLDSLLRDIMPALNLDNAADLDSRYAHYGTSVALSVAESGDDNVQIFSVGEPATVQRKVSVKPEIPVPMDPVVRALGNDLPDIYSYPDFLEVCAPEEYSAIQEKGIKMHKMMCMLKSRRLKERTLRVAYRRGLIRDNYEEAVAMVERALADPKTGPWFDDRNKVCNERSIAIKNDDGKCVYRRPDRIIRTPEGKTVLIDYKFGHNNRSKGKYIKQVQDYAKTLAATGMTVDEGYVWYPETNEIISVPL
ncbi:MAG: UvrD-helicase domain-containing protein [Muribaculaceae bacterium]